MQDERAVVTGGVDTHASEHVAAVVSGTGVILGTKAFSADPGGYAALLDWMRSFGPVGRAGVEGTGSYGAGLARYLAGQGVTVTEVNRPGRQARRRRGKSDPADAEAAARAVLAGEATAVPKAGTGPAESLRVLRIARSSAMKARTQAANQIRDLIITAPADIRGQLAGLTAAARVRACAGLEPGDPATPAGATRQALRTLAARHQALTTEITALTRTIREIATRANPALMAAFGVGPDVASALLVTAGDNPHRMRTSAAFAALCGTSPVDASSGKQNRHRLNRGGDRQANNALWRIAIVRLATDQRTRDYAARRTAQGKTRREIIRCLKRHIAREIHTLLTAPQPLDNQ